MSRLRWIPFEDNDGNDDFFYSIEYEATAAPGTVVGSASDVCKGTCTRALTPPSPASNYVFVLRGFRIYYRGVDHHIDEIALYESNGQLHIRFNDRNNDDTFIWYARWAWVPRGGRQYGVIHALYRLPSTCVAA